VTDSAAPPAKTRLRRLSADEIELWLSVTRSVIRRPGSHLPDLSVPAKPVPPAQSDTDQRIATKPAVTPSPTPQQKPAVALAPIERRLRQKLARGKEAPDAAIDLHGMRRHEAFTALRQFLIRAQHDGAKLVLVVTGKGERTLADGEEAGVLRKSVPLWLHAPDYRSIVVGFEEASRPHGGTGALYVRIRRRNALDRTGGRKMDEL
jgi:DNA-nicking Smr family endonuclease